MNRCKTCKHWGNNTDDSSSDERGCYRITSNDPDRLGAPLGPSDLFAGHDANVTTYKFFGCIEWAAKS